MADNRQNIGNELSIQKRSDEKPKKNGAFGTVTTAQIVLFLILCIVVIIISKTSGNLSQNLKSDFQNLMEWKTIDNAGEAVGAVKDFFNEPFSLLPAFSNSKIETTTQAQTEEEKSENEAENRPETTGENITTSQIQTENEQAEQTTLSQNQDMGGDDIEVYKAADNASFSPVATTSVVVSPVNSKKYTSQFGYRINPITGKRAFHTGLDIAAPQGTKIKAAYSGTVRKIGQDGRSGKYIFLKHDDGYETFYCHCSEILATEGAVIRQGETIALVGSTGWATGPHLHFEVRKNQTRLNPLGILKDADIQV